MKKLTILFTALIIAGSFSCDDEKTVTDPIHEFVSFRGDESVDLNEAQHSDEGYPLVVQLWAFEPYTQEIDLALEVTGSNAQEGVDFTVTPSDQVKIRPGSLTSDTVWIKTINNEEPNELERTFTVTLNSVSKGDVNLGLGLTEPENRSVTFKIVDDECSGSPICVYNATLTNTISGGTEKPASATVDKNSSTVTVIGDLIDYSVFDDATLTITLTPDSQDPTKGTATFGEQETGTDNDGYEYKFVQTGAGTYDTNAATISIAYDIYYLEGSDWVLWYSVTNIFSVP